MVRKYESTLFSHFLWTESMNQYFLPFLMGHISALFHKNVSVFTVGHCRIIAFAQLLLLLFIRRLKPTAMVKTYICVCGVCAVEELR